MHMAQLMPLPLTISRSSKIQIGFTFVVAVHLGSPGQRAVKLVCVCVFFSLYILHFWFSRKCLHCLDAVGWAAGRASGL